LLDSFKPLYYDLKNDNLEIPTMTRKSKPFYTPRDITTSFIKLLNVLKQQGIDITSIKVNNSQSLLSFASKLLKMYMSNNLEKNGKQILLDPLLKNLLPEKDIQELYDSENVGIPGGKFEEFLVYFQREKDCHVCKLYR